MTFPFHRPGELGIMIVSNSPPNSTPTLLVDLLPGRFSTTPLMLTD